MKLLNKLLTQKNLIILGVLFLTLFSFSITGKTQALPEICTNSSDDDGDGTVDCSDSDCSTDLNCVENCIDSADNDLDGDTDCSDSDCSAFPPCFEEAAHCDDGVDNDSDGYTDEADTECDVCGDGVVSQAEVCDDGNVVNDDSCSSLCSDPSCGDGTGTTTVPPTWYFDNDNDSYGDDSQTFASCTNPSSTLDLPYILVGGDCDDTDNTINPNATEVCGDDLDNDCNGVGDETSIWYFDSDNDGYGDSGLASEPVCDDPSFEGQNWAINDDDCNDLDASVSPAATEECDGLDNDCNGTVDTATLSYDADGDGYGDENNTEHPPVEMSCDEEGIANYALFDGDCDDTTTEVNPGHSETCTDSLDNDCDGVIGTGEQSTYYPDSDGDGYGNPDEGLDFCSNETVATGFIVDNTDCDDEDELNNPAATEECDSVDNDCDGTVDEDCSSTTTSGSTTGGTTSGTTSGTTGSDSTSGSTTGTDSTSTTGSDTTTGETTSGSDGILIDTDGDGITDDLDEDDDGDEILDVDDTTTEEPAEDGDEASGTGGCGCDLEATHPRLSIVTFFLLALLPLLFVGWVKNTKKSTVFKPYLF